MARKGRRIPIRIGATLETIEEHLKEQDKEIRRGEWLAFVVFGSSIALSGFFLIVSKYADIWAYAFIVLYGLAMALIGRARGLKIK
jgi:hypothetical protein